MAANSNKKGAVPLIKIFDRLYGAFGPQHWWPGDTPFEIAVGAILTQNTNWGNVEKAIANLKRQRVLSAKKIHEMPPRDLSALIRPAGYFNIKTKRLKAFMDFLMNDYRGSFRRMKDEDMHTLREKLLGVNGIGPETADSILLYALKKPVFVIDAYTKRVLSRHGIMKHEEPYERFQELFHGTMAPGNRKIRPPAKNIYNHLKGLNEESLVRLFNEFHALFVRVGKTFCRPRPLCAACPLNGFNEGQYKKTGSKAEFLIK